MQNDDSIDSESGDSYKPEILTTYNRTKGGVDVVDKLCASYNCARTTRRWPMVVFYSCLNIAGINSQVVYNANNPSANILRRKFLQNLGFSLVENHLHERVKIPQLRRNIKLRLREICKIPESRAANEAVTEFPEKGRCSYCDWKKIVPRDSYAKSVTDLCA